MSQNELDQMSNTGRVIEGGGGRTFVVRPPNPDAYLAGKGVYAEFYVPTSSLQPASKPEWGRHPRSERHDAHLWTAASGDATGDMHSVGVFKVNPIAFVLLWAQSLQVWLAQQDVLLDFGQSPSDRPKRSCWINLKRGEQESELLLWESGEAELSSSHPSAGISQKHYELHELADLGPVLSELLTALG